MSDNRDDVPDELFDALSTLPPVDTDNVTAARIRRAALRELGGRGRVGWWQALRRAYRLAEPGLVFAIAAVYLAQVVQSVLAGYN